MKPSLVPVLFALASQCVLGGPSRPLHPAVTAEPSRPRTQAATSSSSLTAIPAASVAPSRPRCTGLRPERAPRTSRMAAPTRASSGAWRRTTPAWWTRNAGRAACATARSRAAPSPSPSPATRVSPRIVAWTPIARAASARPIRRAPASTVTTARRHRTSAPPMRTARKRVHQGSASGPRTTGPAWRPWPAQARPHRAHSASASTCARARTLRRRASSRNAGSTVSATVRQHTSPITARTPNDRSARFCATTSDE